MAPGTWLEVDAERMHTARYWNIPVRVEHHDPERHSAALRETFLETLRWQTEPYRRIGVSLSGGLDSAVMAAGARHVVGDKELHTFTAGYGPDDRELMNAEMVAGVLGTIHHPLMLRPGGSAGAVAVDGVAPRGADRPRGRRLPVRGRAGGRAARGRDPGRLRVRRPVRRAPTPPPGRSGLKIPLARGPLEEFYDYTFRSVEPHSLAGRALRQAYFRGKAYPAPHVVGARPLPPFAGFPTDPDQPLTNFLRRGFMLNPYQFAIEHLYSAVGVRMNAHHTNPAFIATAFSIPDRLKIHGRTQKYILRKACAGLLPDRMLAFGKSFNRLKHDTEMSDVLDRMADELLPRAAVLARGLFEPGYVETLRRREPGTPYTQERAYRLWSMLLMEMWSRMYLDRRGAPPEAELPPVRYMRTETDGEGGHQIASLAIPLRRPPEPFLQVDTGRVAELDPRPVDPERPVGLEP